jgi:hypothetical protein
MTAARQRQRRKHQRRQKNEVVKLIVTTRERFPHTPGLSRAMRRIIWRYAAEDEAQTRSVSVRRKRRSRAKRAPK